MIKRHLAPVALLSVALAACGTAADARGGHSKRDPAQRAAFVRANPCPATGRAGKCPGYVVDHVKPLACGGADSPSNMQWQTVAEGKAKDKWERRGC